MSLDYLEVATDSGGRTSAAYRPLVHMIRPDDKVFKGQLVYLAQYADLRPDRASEILTQLGVPIPFFGSVAFLHPDRTRWTLELLLAALRLAYFVVMWVKNGLSCRRPFEYSPQVQPIIQTPRHGTLPSGHATEAFIFAFVLWKLLEETKHAPYGDVRLGRTTPIGASSRRSLTMSSIAASRFEVPSWGPATLP